MKYKLKPENTEIESVNATNNLLVFFGKNSDINTVKPIPAIIANKNEYGICLSVITTPSLLAKVSFLIKPRLPHEQKIKYLLILQKE